MTCSFVLLPSPLLGAAVWEPVATALGADGHDAVAVALPGPVASPADVLAAFTLAVPDDREVVLVAHSNAGLYVPAVAAARRTRGLVLVDAALAPFDGGAAPVAPTALLDVLTARADDTGLLPRWSDWWDEDLSSLYPDEHVRRQVEGQQQRLPLAYFRATVPVPAGWDARPCAYLAFGDTYAAETRAAEARGWPVTVLDGRHLEMTVHPATVAAEVLALLSRADDRPTPLGGRPAP